jgi:ketosteroid isomerase-like protein
MAGLDFDEVLERYHAAALEFLNGDPEPYSRLFSQREDVTVANPFGPVARGWPQVLDTMRRAAANYRDGEVVRFENVAKHVTPDLAYVVEVERFRARVGGGGGRVAVVLRTTSVFRPEGGVWKIVHRHADPIVSARPPESVVQK